MPDPSQRAPDKITRFVVERWERLPPMELVKKLPTTVETGQTGGWNWSCARRG